MESAQPASSSVYRGQSRTGEGEGPGRPVQHGEQYLWVAREPHSLWNGELLDTIRPWLTLDSDPADHQRLDDRLESWSLFKTGDLLFVVRLVSAGIYDRRAAYFAHGRAWNINALPPGFDPGLFIGCSAAFDEAGGAANDFGRQISSDVPMRWPEHVEAEQETAARFLGHLFQTRLDGSLLIIAAPVAAFESRGPLHGLIAFARAGLPAALKRTCHVRIYSRMPELFLRHLDANVLVVPEEAASAALSSRPNATLLDRDGSKLAGKELDVRARDYAAAVVGRAIGIPRGLAHFSERLAVNGLPSAEETRSIQVRYNVAFALAGDEERQSKLLREYLPRAAVKLGSGVDWNELIRPNEWDGLPGEALLDHILIDTRELSNGAREFLHAVEEGASRRELAIDRRLADWWDPDDPAKLHRLLELLGQSRRLVSATAAAERTIDIPLETLAHAGPVAGVLRAEAESGLLAQRAAETSELARLADDRSVFNILTRAVFEDRFDPAWASLHVRDASSEKLIDAAEAWLSDGRFWQSWGEVPAQLLDRLRALDMPSRLETLIAAQTALDPVQDPELWLRLADLLSRITKSGNALLPQLWRALPRLLADSSSRALLEKVVFSDAWVCLRPRSLELEHLLALAEGFQNEESHARLHGLLDERMRESPEAATKALVRTGWWFFWRRHSRITDAEVLRRSAIAWLSSDVWTGGHGMEATLEAWDQVIADLPSKLSGEMMAGLRIDGRGQHLWPWIPPFEEEQLAHLIARAQDLGALAELAEAVAAGPSAPDVGVPIHEHVLQQTDFSKELPPSALGWLLRESSKRPSPLTIEQSTYLYRRAGNRPTLALEARLSSVVQHLGVDIREALEAAGDPNLWSDERFLRAVAKWMIDQERINDFAGDWINKHIAGKLTVPIAAPRKLVQDLSDRGWNRAALLLDPDLANRTYVAEADPDSDKVIQALLGRSVKDVCWGQLLKRVNDFRASDGEGQDQHPITIIARRVGSLSPENRAELASHGWATYQDAAEMVKGLMSASPYAVPDLPVFYLAASMLGPGAIGSAAVQVVNAPATRGFRADTKWWRSLFRSIREFKRCGKARSADDRELVALALIWSVLDDRDEQAAFLGARKLEGMVFS